MAKKGDKLARLVNIPIIATKIKDISAEAVTIAAGAAGTVKTFQLNYSPILDSTKEYIGGYGDTSVVFATGVFDVEVESGTADDDLANGEYWIDYITGHGKGKKKTTGTSESVSYSVREEASQFSDPMAYMGVINASANPNYPAADAGYVYVISVAGKIGGASGENVEAGDMIICNTDGSAGGTEAAVGTEWDTIQTNIDGAVTGPASATDNAIAQFNGVTGKIIEDSEIVVTGGANTFVFTKGTAVLDIAASSTVNIDGNLAVESASAINQDLTTDASPTFTAVNATTFDTNVAAAGVTLSGTTLQADGTDAAININITPKGTGDVVIGAFDLDITGSIGATGSRVTKGWFTDLEVTNAIAGSVTGTAATVTGATQASITTCTNLTTVGTIGTGVWQGTTIKANYLQQAAADLGAADVTVDLSNSNGSYVTNLTIDGTLTSSGLALGAGNITMSGSIGVTGTRISKGWFTDLEVTNAIAGSVTGNAGTVTNATLTTALTVNTGTVTLTGNVANTSVLTIGAGAVSVSGANTGDQSAGDFNHDDLANISGTVGEYNHPTDAQMVILGNTSGTNSGDNAANSSSTYIGTTAVALNRASAALSLTGVDIDGNAGTVTNGVYTSSQVTVLAAADAADKDKYLHANASTGAIEWVENSGGVESVELADEATQALETGKTGFLKVWDGTNFAEYAIKADGTTTIVYSDGTCEDDDIDGALCVYDSGSGATIKNRTGGTKTVGYIFFNY